MNERISVHQIRTGQIIQWADGCGMLVNHTDTSTHRDRDGQLMRKLSSGKTAGTGLTVHLPMHDTVTVLTGTVSDHITVVAE